MVLKGTIHTIPSDRNKPGYIIYTSQDLPDGQNSDASQNLRDTTGNRVKHILYWPYDAKGNVYNFKQNDVVKFQIRAMTLNRMGTYFKISVAINLKAANIIISKNALIKGSKAIDVKK